MADSMTAMQTAFGTALATIQTNAMSFITTALPVALGIMGVFIAVKLGIRFFKGAAK